MAVANPGPDVKNLPGSITAVQHHRRGSITMPASRHWTAASLLAVPVAVGLAAGLLTSAKSQTAAAPARADYVPSVSDLMIATIQPRHERLWQAQQQHDWKFAAYELGNLHGAFGRLGRAHPTVDNTSLPDMIASVTDQPFAELKSAIEAKDDAAFAKAYADLTEGCNSCHQALNHGAVAIGVPDGSSLTDLKAVKPARP
jgi:hypothetical protein